MSNGRLARAGGGRFGGSGWRAASVEDARTDGQDRPKTIAPSRYYARTRKRPPVKVDALSTRCPFAIHESMEQGIAIRLGQEMANGIAALYHDEGHPIGQDRLDKFKAAAIYHAYEFIPDEADAIVLTVGGLPLLVAAQGDRFYKLGFAPFELEDDGTPETICEMVRIRPELASLTVQAVYEQTVANVLTRTSEWAFSIDGNNFLSFVSERSTGREPGEAERFARSLAEAMGWGIDGEISPP